MFQAAPSIPMTALPLMQQICFRFRWHGRLGQTCYWFDLVANDTQQSSRMPTYCYVVS